MAKKSKCKKDPTERVTKSDHCTIPHIKEALQSYNNILDTSTLNTNEFWNTEQVYDYEDTLDTDKFYDIKKFHEVLNGKHDCNSTANIDLKWWDYVSKAMSHRLSLTAKRNLPILTMMNQFKML